MDLELIKEAFKDEPEILLDELGLEYEKKSNKLWVLCPFHNDTHLGNAILTNGWFHCFACGAGVDCLGLTREVLGCSFPDAVIFCTQAYGLSLSYEENPLEVKLRLTKQEEEALMLPKTKVSLKKVLMTDKEAYKSIVSEQAEKMIKKYRDIINFYGRRDATEAYMVKRLDNNWSPNTHVEITREATNRIQTLQGLIRRIKL